MKRVTNKQYVISDIHTIILISGKAGAGKDTLADYLVKFYNYKKFSFADCLKKDLSKKLGIKLNNFYDREKKVQVIETPDGRTTTLRMLMINEGKRGREIDENFWVDRVLENLVKLNKTCKNAKIVIPDFRFPSEYYRIKSFFKENFITINILNNNYEYINDESETSLMNFAFDYTFVNDGGKKDLYKKFEDNNIEI